MLYLWENYIYKVGYTHACLGFEGGAPKRLLIILLLKMGCAFPGSL